jgi:hypothetical protein
MAFTSTRATAAYLRNDDALIAFRNGRWEVGVASTSPSMSYTSREGAIAVHP